MAAIISIVGKGKTGKTTLVEKLVAVLSSRGYRVATAKHVFHELSFDKQGKDSWRHLNAGSKAVAFGSSDKIVLIQPTGGTVTIEAMLRLVGEDYDLIIVEGFKRSHLPKIEVCRKEKGPPLAALPNLIAIATDEKLDMPIRQFDLSDAEGIADFIEDSFIKAKQDHLTLFVNKKHVTLDLETTRTIIETINALIPALAQASQEQTVEILLRKTGRNDR